MTSRAFSTIVHTPLSEPLNLQVRSDFNAIAPANDAASDWLGKQNAGPSVSYFVRLAIEELVSNCVKYAYDDHGEHIIRFRLSIEDETLTMIVVDDGHAFDPLSVSPLDLSQDSDERPIGGLGLHLLRKMADTMEYERRGSTNRLTLTKRMS